MLRKRFRVFIDVDIDIEDVTRERVARDQHRRAEARAEMNLPPSLRDFVEEPPGEVEIEAQNDLLQALLNDERRLEELLLHHLVSDLNDWPSRTT